MSTKTSLQQLMGGTSDVKESFLPGMGDIYSNIKGDDELGEGEGEGDGEGDGEDAENSKKKKKLKIIKLKRRKLKQQVVM